MHYLNSNFIEKVTIMKKASRIFLPVAMAAMAMGAGAQVMNEYHNHDAINHPHGVVFPIVAIPDLPQAMVLAGDTVSLDRLDMAERLDREMTSIVYGQTTTFSCFKRANRYFPVIAPILEEQGMPLDLLYLAVTESMMDPAIKSPAGAVGLWQLMPATARQYGLEVNDDVDERCDPVKSTYAACKYLKSARAHYGNWANAFASYNAGMGRINGELSKQGQGSAFDLQLVSETSRYVFRIMAYKLVMENPKRYGYSMKTVQLYHPRTCRVVEVKTSVASWIDWAKREGITYAQLRDANPWIRSNRLPNAGGKTYRVNVPETNSLYLSKRDVKAYNPAWVVD